MPPGPNIIARSQAGSGGSAMAGFGVGEAVGAGVDLYNSFANRRAAEKEGKATRRQQRDESLIDLILKSLAVDFSNRRRQASFDFGQNSGMNDRAMMDLAKIQAPRPPATSFRAPGEAPAAGPGQGSGPNAGLDFTSQLGVGSFEAFRRMKHAMSAGPTMAQDPIQVINERFPGLSDALIGTKRGDTAKNRQRVAQSGFGPGSSGLAPPGMSSRGGSITAFDNPSGATAAVDPEEENRKKLTKIFSELLNKEVGI